MPYFTLNRNFTLNSVMGHSIKFVKGEKTWVAPEIVSEVVAIGGETDEDVTSSLASDPDALPAVPVGLERKTEVFEAFKKLLARAARGDFTAQGLPHIKALKSVVGFDIDNKERDHLWQEYIEKTAEEKAS